MPRGTVAKKGRAIAQGYHATDSAAALHACELQAFKVGPRIVDTGIY
jgi:hypothetical protein